MKQWIAIGLAVALIGGLSEACSGMIQLPNGTVEIGGYFYVDTDNYTVDRSESNLAPGKKRTPTRPSVLAVGGSQVDKSKTFPGPLGGSTQATNQATKQTNSTVFQGPLRYEVFEQRDDGFYYLVKRITDLPVFGGDEEGDTTDDEELSVPPPPPPPAFVPVGPDEIMLPFEEPGAVMIPAQVAPIDLETAVVIS